MIKDNKNETINLNNMLNNDNDLSLNFKKYFRH